jgi:hypothetical protein
MPTQVITIRPDGGIFGLQHKRGQGLDLRKLGHAEVRRETLIEWETDRQAWFIKWTEPARDEDGQAVWDSDTFHAAKVNHRDFTGFVHPFPSPDSYPEWCVFFNDYEDAVAAEVAVIQALQVRGRLTA